MSVDVIKEITEAENKAGEMIEKAKADAQVKVKKAQQDAIGVIANKTSEAKIVANKTIDQANEEAKSNMEAILKENETACIELSQKAKNMYNKASKYILERIEG